MKMNYKQAQVGVKGKVRTQINRTRNRLSTEEKRNVSIHPRASKDGLKFILIIKTMVKCNKESRN